MAAENPLLADWSTRPFGIPPFSLIKTEHFSPAFDVALAQHLEEAKAIAENKEVASFENTIVAFDRCGVLLNKVQGVFSNLCLSICPPELQEVEAKMAGPLAVHSTKIYMLPGLFDRVEAVHSQRESLGLDPESLRLIERIHLDFIRAGARFDVEAKKRYNTLVERLAELTTKFSNNVLTDEATVMVELTSDDMAGCPEEIIAAATSAAVERNAAAGVHMVSITRSLVVPFLTFAHSREAREKVWRTWTSRGELHSTRDNHAIAIEILKLRNEQAAMHGYATFADFQTADTMAQSPQAVMGLLESVWEPAKRAAERERQDMETFIAGQGQQIDVEPWDWRYYAEKVRQAQYNFDESLIKPYLSLDSMVAAIFDVANKLFGISFVHRPDIDAYHPDVKIYEVHETADGVDKVIAIFIHDNYFRPHKRSGAWMSEFRTQTRNTPDGSGVIPVVINNNNFTPGNENTPCLLSFDDAVTLFHEFGHGCHGMLSAVKYLRLAGTSVLRDFVELPSQLMEHWLTEAAVLKQHARHYKTGEPIPGDLLNKLVAARSFQQGFATIEYSACALVDQALHALPSYEGLDLKEFEKTELARLGMPQGIVMRHRLPHFLHMFSGESYAAAYYVYLWAEVLDADGFEAFLEAGSCFDPETAARVRQYIYSTGNSLEPGAAYRAFRGRDPSIKPMLKKKGLDKA